MNLHFQDVLIPGTILKKSKMNNLTGRAFLDNVFLISKGVMMGQIREISGIDSSTLQNWTKRGWVSNSKLKRYDINQVAHILMINMLRSCMRLEDIDFLIRFINGDVDRTDDDIVEDADLYDYICRILEAMTETDACDLNNLSSYIEYATKDYQEPLAGAHRRLNQALEVIVTTYYASLIKHQADDMLAKIR